MQSQGGARVRIDTRSRKYRTLTLQGGEDYQTVRKLYVGNREIDQQFNEDG